MRKLTENKNWAMKHRSNTFLNSQVTLLADGQVSNEVTCLHMWESNSKVTYTNSGLNEFTNGVRV